jgi:hypothetical protein
MNDELERICKEAVVSIFEVLSRNFPGWTEENHKNLIQGSRDLNPEPPEYEAGVLITRLF